MGCNFSHRVKRCGTLSTSQFLYPPSALPLIGNGALSRLEEHDPVSD